MGKKEKIRVIALAILLCDDYIFVAELIAIPYFILIYLPFYFAKKFNSKTYLANN